MRAISAARSREISPSCIMPVSAMPSACRAVDAASQPPSSQFDSGGPGDASVPNSTFSGYISSQARIISASARG